MTTVCDAQATCVARTVLYSVDESSMTLGQARATQDVGMQLQLLMMHTSLPSGTYKSINGTWHAAASDTHAWS